MNLCKQGLKPTSSLHFTRQGLNNALNTPRVLRPRSRVDAGFVGDHQSSPNPRDSPLSPISRDVPHVPPPLISQEYPPRPFSSYKPIPSLNPRRLLRIYSQLSKGRLTVLNVIVAMSGVALAPANVGVPILLATAVGTTLCSAAANTTNQLLEVPFDAQMARTRNRPFVRRAISPLHGASFAAVTGIAGPAILYTFVNPLTAALGLFNVLLYAGVYTFMKRRTIWNTWVGAIVGAVPAVMGWTAAGGHIFPSASHPIQTFLPSFLTNMPALPLEAIDNPLAPAALFTLMFSWQFPHFNPLSHLMRASYAQAGYRMLCVSNPKHNGLVSLRHTALLFPICSVLVPLSGLTTWAFALTSLPINAIALNHAWKFWKQGSDKTAKKLFGTMLWHLPAILGLMMFHKQGMDWLKRIGDKSGSNDRRSRVTNVPGRSAIDCSHSFSLRLIA
ncbi:protoheme IX farnesyltransferase [Clavulina sp. PMI_390]|nr:protoheme IX farnesyltransferase [Clavulina sp. PMI_390]